MWAIVTENDEIVKESRDCRWPCLATDIKIRELRYSDRRGRSGKIEGFSLYGFQRFSISMIDGSGSVDHAGTQLIGVDHNDRVTIVEINEVTGFMKTTNISLDDLTYNRDLLRTGLS